MSLTQLRIGFLFLACVGLCPCAVATSSVSAEDWSAWRGPHANGVAESGQNIPVQFGSSQSVVWRVEIPGRGHSSPTVAADRIFLATADESSQTQSVVALDRATGKSLWKTDISQGGFPNTHRKNTHATCTVACDGERVFVAFHHHRTITLTALSVDGAKLWEEKIGPYDPRKYEYGYAPSPVLFENLVIIAADYEKGGCLAASDRASGKRAWKTRRPDLLSFSSPIVANIRGKQQLLLSGCELVSAYDPRTGNRLWAANGTTMATCGTMVWDNGLVFASGGYPKAETICVQADGSGKVVWRNNTKCYEQSMLVADGHVYAVTDTGIAVCWRANDGRQMWQSRLKGPVSASPILVDGNIIAANESGTFYVFRARPDQFELLATNQLGNEAFATPSVCGGRMYVRVAEHQGRRRQEFLYCIGAR